MAGIQLGPNTAQAGADVASLGTGPGTINWTNPTAAQTDNNVRARTSNTTNQTRYLRAKDFQFSVPTYGLVELLGCLFEADGRNTLGGVDVSIGFYPYIAGSVGSQWGSSGTLNGTSDAIISVGGEAELPPGLTIADVNDSDNFGFAIAKNANSSNARSTEIDALFATIWYHFLPPPAVVDGDLIETNGLDVFFDDELAFLKSGEFYTVALDGAVGALGGSLTRATIKELAGTPAAFAGTLVILAAINLSGSWAAPSGTLTPIKVAVIDIAGTMGAVAGSLIRSPRKALTGAAGSISGSLTRTTNKVLGGAWASPTGTLETIKVAIVVLTGSWGAPYGTLVRSTLKSLSGSPGALSGSLVRRLARTLTGAWGGPTGAVAIFRMKYLSGAWGAPTGSLKRDVAKLLLGSWATPSGNLTRATSLHLAGIWGGATGIAGAMKSGIEGLRAAAARAFTLTPPMARATDLGNASARITTRATAAIRWLRPHLPGGRDQDLPPSAGRRGPQ